MRVTRAALRAEAAQSSGRETPDASQSQADAKDRVPLSHVSANSSPDPPPSGEPLSQVLSKKTKAPTSAKRNTRGKRTAIATQIEDDEAVKSEAGTKGFVANYTEAAEHIVAPVETHAPGEQPVDPSSRSVRMTRRQLAKQEESSALLHVLDTPESGPVIQSTVTEILGPLVSDSPALANTEPVDAQEPTFRPPRGMLQHEGQEEPDPAPQGLPVELSQPEPKTLMIGTSYGDEGDPLTPVTAVSSLRVLSRSPSRSPSARTPIPLEKSISAIDALEEALENVGKDLPRIDQLTEEKSPRKARFPRNANLITTVEGKSAPPRVSKNSNIAPSFQKSTGLSRACSVRAPPKDKSGPVDYLAARRRPISMTFNAPPPPAKSTKAPTKSSFQLPGEVVAAKLKAQKEERLKREAEVGPVKRRPISIPPPPKSTKPPTLPNFQLPGEAIAARLKAQKEERLKRETREEKPPSRQVVVLPPKSSKPPTIPRFQLPGDAVAAKLKAQKEERLKREEEAEAARRAAIRVRPASVRRSVAPPVRQTATSQAREKLMGKDDNDPSCLAVPLPQRSRSVMDKRSSTVLSRAMSRASAVSTNSSSRNSVVMHTGAGATGGPVVLDAEALKIKGKEVFEKDVRENESRSMERKEKEEAAKRARAEAAERGRIASREWAEKQRKKAMMAAAAARAQAA